jgi:sugar phosphate isomerase/epimerase
MNVTLGYSTLGFAEQSVEAALDAIAAIGYRGVELLGYAPHMTVPMSGAGEIALRRRLERCGFAGWTIHSPLGRNVLGAPEEEWRREVMARCAQYIRFASAIGARELVIHPVPNPMFVEYIRTPDLPARIGAAVERSLDELTPLLQQAGVRLLLENLPYDCDYPYLEMNELRPLVERYPVPAVGLVIDTGHVGTLRHDPAAEIRRAGARLCATHLHDVDTQAPNDQHWMPSSVGMNWSAILAALQEVGYAGIWMFEVSQPQHGESPELLARENYAWAKEWIGIP